jgi:hypothetical protein
MPPRRTQGEQSECIGDRAERLEPTGRSLGLHRSLITPPRQDTELWQHLAVAQMFYFDVAVVQPRNTPMFLGCSPRIPGRSLS